MLSYIKCLGKYSSFGGRSTRREFWGYTIVNLLIISAFIWARSAARISDITQTTGSMQTLQKVIEYTFIVYVLITFCPSLAAMCRRWHDLGRTGHWLWGHLILLLAAVLSFLFLKAYLPYVLICNAAYLAVTLGFYLCKGDAGANRYGENPDEKKKRRKR